MQLPIKPTEISVGHLFSAAASPIFEIGVALSGVKAWMEHSDKVLSTLSKDLINRNLPKVVVQNTPFSKEQLQQFYSNCNEEIDQQYFVHVGTVKNLAYNKEKYPINIRMKGGKIANIISVSDHLNLETLTQPVIKHFAYYPK